MTKSNNTSSDRVYIVLGSSSSLASAINNKLSSESKRFFGRTNPHGINSWQEAVPISTFEDADKYTQMVVQELERLSEEGFVNLSLIIIAGVSSEDWIQSIAINEYFPSRLTEEAIRLVEQTKEISDFSITYIGSAASYLGGKYPYSVTKASLTGLLHSSNKRSPKAVRTNLVVPGAFDGGMIADWDEDKRRQVSQNTTIGRIASSNEVADALIFTATNKYMADSVLNMSAGQVVIE